MKVCHQCNIEYQDNLKFCPECGSKLESKVVLDPNYGPEFSYIEYRLVSGIDNLEVDDNNLSTTFFRIDTDVKDDDFENSIEDEFGVKYSHDGVRLLVGSNVDDYQVKDGVMVICKNAFSECKRLKSISLPSSVMLIGDSGFSGCESLQEITLPNSVVSVGKFSFERSMVKSITLSESLINIGESAFRSCPIEKIKIPNSVTRIGKFAFSDCQVLKQVVIPPSIEILEESVFNCCKELENVTMPDTIKAVKSNAFSECSSLSSICFSKGLTVIENSAFKNCTSLQKISLPIYLKNIGNSAFEGCEILSQVILLDSTTILGEKSFWGCLSIRSFIVPNGAKDNYKNVFVDNSINLNRVICECNDVSEICDDIYFAYANQYDVVKPLFRNWFVVGVITKSPKGHWYDKYYEGVVDSNNNIVIPIQHREVFIYDNMLIATGKNALVMDFNANKLIESEIFIENKKDCPIIRQDRRNQILRHDPFYVVSPNFFEAEKFNEYLYKLYGCYDWDFDNYRQDRTYFRIIDRLNRDILGKNYTVIDEINGVYFLLSDVCQSRELGYDIAIEKNGHILINEDMSLKLFPSKDGYIIFRQEYKYGLFDASFRTIISAKYDSLEFIEPGILRTGRQLINYKEERLVKSAYDYVTFSTKFDRVWQITENLYAARKYEEDGNEEEYNINNLGLIDKKGQTVLPFEYEGICKFRLNNKTLIKFYQNSKAGIVAIDGKTLLIDAKYNHIDSFYLNRKVIHPYTTVWNQNGLDRLYGVINEDLKEILPPVHQILRFPSEGLITLMTNDLWGIFHINENTTQLIYDCTFLGNFVEGLCSINKGGKIRISKEYDEEHENDFYIGPNYNVYLNAEGGKWGFINAKGEIVVPIEYDSVQRFQEGLAPVCIEDKWGFVDSNGALVVSLKYKSVSGFNNGTSICYLEYETYGNYEIIDKNGTIIEKGYERQTHNDSYDSENWYTQKELNDMYREAFDDNPDNYWGND